MDRNKTMWMGTPATTLSVLRSSPYSAPQTNTTPVPDEAPKQDIDDDLLCEVDVANYFAADPDARRGFQSALAKHWVWSHSLGSFITVEERDMLLPRGDDKDCSDQILVHKRRVQRERN